LAELKRLFEPYQLKVHIEPWRDRETIGEVIIDGLVDHCRGGSEVATTDFFAVFLTADDLRTRAGSNEPQHVPRDNCIFELGLFFAGMGFEKHRCFVLSSVPSTALPSDLNGWKFIPFIEPSKDCGPRENKESVRLSPRRFATRFITSETPRQPPPPA
jgi:predicted nucleotide-binding protein